MKKKFTRKQLEDRSGVTARNIRYYIAQGLVPAPHGQGRGSHYTKKHLKRLKQIVRLREKGSTIEQIRLEVNSLGELLIEGMEEAFAHSKGEIELTTHTTTSGFVQVEGPTAPGELTIWDHHWLTKNVQVLIRRDLKSKARHKIAKALKALATTLEEG